MNKLIMTVISDNLDFLNMVDAESARYFESNEHTSAYYSAISRVDDEATMGTPPDGEEPYDVAREIEDEKSEDYDPIDIRIHNINVDDEEDVYQVVDRMNKIMGGKVDAVNGYAISTNPKIVEMEPTTIGPATQFFAPDSESIKINTFIVNQPQWAETGQPITADHYNQMLALLIEIRKALWELQKN